MPATCSSACGPRPTWAARRCSSTSSRYSITSLAAFGIITAVERVGSRTVMLEDVEGFFRVRPWGALSMGVCLLSLLGFPGTFGFIGKWYS